MSDTLQAPAALLEEARKRGEVIDAEGVARPLNSEIPEAFSRALSAQIARQQPKLALEIGMACGFSTLAILDALPADGRLISIDPFQHTDYHSVGHTLVSRSTRAGSHELVQDFDYIALPKLVEQGVKLDFAYIDGMHTFDYVALDAFYVDKLLNVGGVVAFNDCGFRSIHKFLKFFVGHRKYEELDVGLKPDYRGRNLAVTAVRTLTKRSAQDRYFRKLADWEPVHNYFKPF